MSIVEPTLRQPRRSGHGFWAGGGTGAPPSFFPAMMFAAIMRLGHMLALVSALMVSFNTAADAPAAAPRDGSPLLLTGARIFDEGYREALTQELHLTEIERRLGDPAVIASLDDLSERFPRYRPPAFPDRSRIASENLVRVHAAGVRVAAGSDAGNIGTLHGPALHRELELMSQAGLSPREILVTATRNGAATMGRGSDLGTLRAGKLADILVLKANPLQDIRKTRRIAAVIKGGVLYRPEPLMQQIDASTF